MREFTYTPLGTTAVRSPLVGMMRGADSGVGGRVDLDGDPVDVLGALDVHAPEVVDTTDDAVTAPAPADPPDRARD